LYFFIQVTLKKIFNSLYKSNQIQKELLFEVQFLERTPTCSNSILW